MNIGASLRSTFLRPVNGERLHERKFLRVIIHEHTNNNTPSLLHQELKTETDVWHLWKYLRVTNIASVDILTLYCDKFRNSSTWCINVQK